MKTLDQRLINRAMIYIFLFDLCIMPTFHIAGIPFKLSYCIGFLFVFLYHTTNRDYILPMKCSPKGRLVLNCISLIMALTLLGEMTTIVRVQTIDSSSFRNAMFFYFVFLGGVILSYCESDFDKDFLVILLLVYCLLNISLSALGVSTPSVIKRLYSMNNEGSAFSLRTSGTLGNPNATLCVMNMLYMSIVHFIKNGEIDITNNLKLSIILILPILTNCFINSRGEFLVTSMITISLIVVLIKSSESFTSTVLRLSIIAILSIMLIFLVSSYLIAKYPTVKYSIDRLTSLFTSSTNTAIETDSLSDRPFIHMQEFWDRFSQSPIWGTGFSSGGVYPYLRSCQSYHNDWFRIMGSSGILGLLLWVILIVVAIGQCGPIVLLPFFITSLSNTFIASPPALGVYYLTVMCSISKKDVIQENEVVRWHLR